MFAKFFNLADLRKFIFAKVSSSNQNILNYALLKTTHTEITELEQFSDPVEKRTHCEKVTTTMVSYMKE